MNNKIDQLGNKISIIPLSDVLSISGNNYTLSTEKNIRSYYTINDINFEQKSSTSDAGDLYNQNLTAIIQKDDDILRFMGQNILIILYSLQGNKIIWGSKDFPVKLKITPFISKLSIDLSRSSPIALIF